MGKFDQDYTALDACLERMNQVLGERCRAFSDDEIAAYVDGRARRRLRRLIEWHLPHCEECRDSVSLLQELAAADEEEARQRAAAAPARPRTVAWRQLVPVGVVCLLLGVFVPRVLDDGGVRQFGTDALPPLVPIYAGAQHTSGRVSANIELTLLWSARPASDTQVVWVKDHRRLTVAAVNHSQAASDRVRFVVMNGADHEVELPGGGSHKFEVDVSGLDTVRLRVEGVVDGQLHEEVRVAWRDLSLDP